MKLSSYLIIMAACLVFSVFVVPLAEAIADRWHDVQVISNDMAGNV